MLYTCAGGCGKMRDLYPSEVRNNTYWCGSCSRTKYWILQRYPLVCNTLQEINNILQVIEKSDKNRNYNNELKMLHGRVELLAEEVMVEYLQAKHDSKIKTKSRKQGDSTKPEYSRGNAVEQGIAKAC